MPKSNGKSLDLCNESNCFEPRFQTPKHRYQKCETHMRETWRKYATNDDTDSPPRRERPASRKPVSSSPRHEGEGLGVRVSPALCPTCRRSPHQAAHAALHRSVWCSTCTPMSTPRAELESRLNPALNPPSLNSERGLGGEVESLRNQLDHAQREIRVLRAAVNAQPDESEFQVLVLDFEENCVRYLTGCQQRSEPFPTNRDEVADLQINAARRGFILARRHKFSLLQEAE